MTKRQWFKVDEDFQDHPKILAAGNEAAGMYVRALAYCSRHLSDGFVPRAWVKQHATARLIERITNAQLWREVTAGEVLNGGDLVALSDGFYIPDYTVHNRSKAEVRAMQEAMKEGGKEGARRRWNTD